MLALGLGLAALLNAEGLRKQAQIQPQGFERRLALAVTRPLVSRQPDAAPDDAAPRASGRDRARAEDAIDSQVHLGLPPPAGPVPAPRTHQPKPVRHVVKPRFTAAHPLRVWVAGDSLAQVPGEGARADLRPRRSMCAGVESRLSTGLARPDLYNWFTRFRQVITQLQPQVAVLSFGADDAHDLPRGRSRRAGTVGPLGSSVVERGVPPPGRRRDARARCRRRLRHLARPADPRRRRLQEELSDRQRDHRAGCACASARRGVRRHLAPARRRARPLHAVPARARPSHAHAAA